MPKMSHFGEFCKQARKQMGLTYLQAMMRINSLCQKREKPLCTERSLIRWEQGEVMPKIEAVKAMSIAYGQPDLLDKRIENIEFLRKARRRRGQEFLYEH